MLPSPHKYVALQRRTGGFPVTHKYHYRKPQCLKNDAFSPKGKVIFYIQLFIIILFHFTVQVRCMAIFLDLKVIKKKKVQEGARKVNLHFTERHFTLIVVVWSLNRV